jgi:hypothetical protein
MLLLKQYKEEYYGHPTKKTHRTQNSFALHNEQRQMTYKADLTVVNHKQNYAFFIDLLENYVQISTKIVSKCTKKI